MRAEVEVLSYDLGHGAFVPAGEEREKLAFGQPSGGDLRLLFLFADLFENVFCQHIRSIY